jgi:ribonuclease HI
VPAAVTWVPVAGGGVLLVYGEHEKELCGGELETTNNRMELLAAIQGLAAKILDPSLPNRQYPLDRS